MGTPIIRYFELQLFPQVALTASGPLEFGILSVTAGTKGKRCFQIFHFHSIHPSGLEIECSVHEKLLSKQCGDM